MLFAVSLAGLGSQAAGCGGDDGAGAADAGRADAAGPRPDAGPTDAGPPPGPDAGPPPGCDLETLSTTFAPGFTGDREGGPEALVAAAPEGPFAYAGAPAGA